MSVLFFDCFINSFHNSSFRNSTIEFDSVKETNIVSGAVALISVIALIDVTIKNKKKKVNVSNIFRSEVTHKLIAIFLAILILPLMLISLITAWLYKMVCSVIIFAWDENSIKFLNSFDVFWSLEENINSIIHVVGTIEIPSVEHAIDDIKNMLKNLMDNESVDKIFYRRKVKYGFYYWNKNNTVDIDQYVKIVELSKPISEDKIKSSLEVTMRDICNKPLPYDNEGLFQILITKQPVSQNEGKYEHGLIFRIHHSVGDGVALVDLLCTTLADDKQLRPLCLSPTPHFEQEHQCFNVFDKIKTTAKCFLRLIEAISRKADCNSLHGPELEGKKIFKWIESDENVLKMIKEIKKKNYGFSSSHILAIALSSGLEKYFLKTMLHIPKNVAVVIPIRFSKMSQFEDNIKLENDFSVTIMDLPIKGRNKVISVKQCCDELRGSASPLANYYFIKLICGIFPKSILQNILTSYQPTLVFSNLPGPEAISICEGIALNKLVFFVPHRGSTGLGITAFSYGGVLRFSAMVDTALISEPTDLSIILIGMVDKIKSLHNEYCK